MWFLFVFILLLELLFAFRNYQTSACIKNRQVLYALLLHHIGNSFLLYGWLFSNKLLLMLHILTVIGIAIYWKLNNNRCDLTIYINRMCGYPEDRPFHDLLDIIGLKELPMWNELGHYIFIMVGMLVSAWKIGYNK